MVVINGESETSADQLPFARSYQIEALEQAIKQNTIVFLETGSGKTLIAIMLLRHYAYLLQKPSPFIAVFLVPTVVLVKQQADSVRKHVDLKVEEYWGEKVVDLLNIAAYWKKQQDENQLLVMTPQILLNALNRSFLSLDNIKLLIFDECHRAKKKYEYALIMKEFYHPRLCDGGSQLPRILGMTASPVEAKVSSSPKDYWEQMNKLETMLNSKVYTCSSESVLSDYIPVSTVKIKFYKNMAPPYHVLEELKNTLSILRQKHESKVSISSTLSESSRQNAIKRLSILYSTFEFCLDELGIFLASKAAEAYSCDKNDMFLWGQLDLRGENISREFCKDANKVFCSYIPNEWSITQVNEATVSIGLLSTKVACLIESLAEYRDVKEMRCLIFVERVVTARVLKSLLSELHSKLFDWKTEYVAGNNALMQSQSRGVQNKIVDEFHKGIVNIIVATSILEEGLDVQKCNLVIRFDPASTVCSFIQSRGRARMQNSDFLLLVKSGDDDTLNKVNNYLLSGKIMRDESLSHASEPCGPLEKDLYDEVVYHVESTGATLRLSSSISMVYFYCSRLPSDGYFKPYPRFVIDKELKTCTIYFPKSCPLPSVHVSGPTKMLKQLACFEACKQLHAMGALTDNLIPDTLKKSADDEQETGIKYVEEQVQYIPPELVGFGDNSSKLYHFYTINLEKHFDYNIPLQDIVLAVSTKLEFDNEGLTFDLEADRGDISVSLTYIGTCKLTSEQITLTNQFQMVVLTLLIHRSISKLKTCVDSFKLKNDADMAYDYLLLPSAGPHKAPMIVEWKAVKAAMFSYERGVDERMCCLKGNNHEKVHTKSGLVCSCLVDNSLVYTPHNGRIYCTTERLLGLNGNSTLEIKEGEVVTYKNHYKRRHGVDLMFEKEPLFAARQLFTVQNFLQKGRQQKEKETSNAGVELPSELCDIIMSPVSISTIYSFSFVPSIMHRIESWMIALNLKKMHLCHSMPNADVPVIKVLEAITTKKCVEKFHLESFETLGDSFLKYAATQQLFKTLQDQHEGILSPKREKIISNDSLCRLGCNCNLPGFIRNEPFEPKTWIVPGDRSSSFKLEEEVLLDERKMYIRGKRVIKKKVVADVVEALIGVFLSEGGELAALSFMRWIGISVDFVNTPYTRALTLHPEKYVNIQYFESLLNYSFRDVSLLVEAITHGSYMLPEIPKCYQRLEFLGDAVLDYMITVHLYNKYPGMSPGMLTDLRSASVNNDCYAQSAVKYELHKHILHGSQDLHRAIVTTVHEFDQLSMKSTFGWESETSFPKVLGDVIESIAGAILVDSGYDKDKVFQSIRPLLDPLVTPETLKLHPVKELHDICQKNHFEMKKSAKRGTTDDGTISFTIEIVKDNIVLKDSCMAADKKMAERLASKSVLKLLKEYLSAA
ncbi:endoribonuclease Dicer homolog 2 [Lactuca sativa]|uniref:endoribonuclease Dicer homolog 2 n=1 Tax=Lactuca sativa TaxID=4236 RepID=UPI000CB87434|nr:endoribonuclease Dicer homolog 2 [Lactuca sativa]